MPGREDIFQQAMNAGHSAAWDQNWETACAAYQKALVESPDNPKALMNLGLAFYQLQRYEDGLKIYLRAAQVAPEDPVALEKVAQLSERLGNISQAIQAALQAAELYIKNQDATKAIENWLHITSLDADHLIAHSRLAMVHERLGHAQQALTEYLATASILQRTGNGEKANEMVTRALQLNPNSTEARQAQAMLKGGQALPKPMRPKGGTGPLRMAQVRKQEAVKPAETALDPIAEARQKAITRLAEVLFDLSTETSSDPVSSKRGLQAIVRGTGPLNVKQDAQTKIFYHLGLAVDAQTHGKGSQAAEELERALEAGFQEAALYYDLGLLRSKGERLESSLRYLQHAVKHEDYALGARLLMGQLLRQLERLPEAVIEYMEALKVADTQMIPPEQADALRQLYEPLIESQSNQEDPKAMGRLCDNLSQLLMRPNWRAAIRQAREQLPKGAEGAPPLPLAEVLTQASSSQVIESINKVHQLVREGRLRSAMDEAFHSLKYAPTYLPLHSLIGDLLLQEGNLQGAITKYTVVAQAYSIRGESNQAVNILRRITKVAPMDLVVRSKLIEQLSSRGQVNEAISEYLDLADIYYRLAELDMARKTYTQALRLAQQGGGNRDWSVKLMLRMADIDMQRLDWRQAMRVFEQVRTLEPNDIATRRQLVDLNLRLNQLNQAAAEIDGYISYLDSNGRRVEAITFLEDMVKENERQPVLRKYLAEEYRRIERIEDAVAQLDALGDILLESGDRVSAIKTIEAIIAMNPANLESYKTVLESLK